MFVMLKLLALAVLVDAANPQFIAHPYGGLSYNTNGLNHQESSAQASASAKSASDSSRASADAQSSAANSANSYSYRTPEGQLVNVKLSSSRQLSKTTKTTTRNFVTFLPPQVSYGSQLPPPQPYYFAQPQSQPQVIESQMLMQPQVQAPAMAFPAQFAYNYPQFPYEPQPLSLGAPEIVPAIQPGAPSIEQLFVPGLPGTFPVESDKQLQAYNDYVRDLQNENLGFTTPAVAAAAGAVPTTPDVYADIGSLANLKF